MKKEKKQIKHNQEVDICFEHVTKSYSNCKNDLERLLSVIWPFKKFQRRQILNDINFKIYQGDKIAFIGKNGSGKSTILKIISNITTPDSGLATIKRKVSILLEVNTGFDPEFSARENIITRAVLLGIDKKTINSLMDKIFEFAEIEECLRDQQIKKFSSGMIAKLGFSINILCFPEILIIDEVLAVGDISFKLKVEQTIKEYSKNNNITLLFVSHDEEIVRELCTRGIYIKNGKIAKDGEINDVLNTYNNDIKEELKLSSKINNK